MSLQSPSVSGLTRETDLTDHSLCIHLKHKALARKASGGHCRIRCPRVQKGCLHTGGSKQRRSPELIAESRAGRSQKAKGLRCKAESVLEAWRPELLQRRETSPFPFLFHPGFKPIGWSHSPGRGLSFGVNPSTRPPEPVCI